jgi:hypothetical protein
MAPLVGGRHVFRRWERMRRSFRGCLRQTRGSGHSVGAGTPGGSSNSWERRTWGDEGRL